jgi:hypothetical protein
MHSINTETNRTTREMSQDERERLERQRAAVVAELPDLVQRDQMRKEAHEEQTLSGELRRAIHASQQPLAAIAAQSGITVVQLDEFLTGERSLRSDVLDRLAAALGFHFQPTA